KGAASIHDRLTAAFGDLHSLRDVDGEPRIHVVLSPFTGHQGPVGGYVTTADMFPDDTGPGYGNHREVLYLQSRFLTTPSRDPERPAGAATLAHEYGHLLTFGRALALRHAFPQKWWAEGTAELAAHLAGHGLGQGEGHQAASYLSDLPRWPMWTTEQPSGEQYGQNFLLALWLHERWGQALVDEILQTEDTSLGAFDKAMGKRGLSREAAARAWGLWLTGLGGHVRLRASDHGPSSQLRSVRELDSRGGPWFRHYGETLPTTSVPGSLHWLTFADGGDDKTFVPPEDATATLVEFAAPAASSKITK
ncbi:MAG: hypothetical protein VKO21_09460, partial [Candidatus Sericytochromatia bacterium]|nr:hypothetical protein [Candidatus Sericytochromatia bacterium]